MTHIGTTLATHRPVHVLDEDGAWAEGWLEAYREVDGAWYAYVRLTSGRCPGWVEGRRVRGRASGSK